MMTGRSSRAMMHCQRIGLKARLWHALCVCKSTAAQSSHKGNCDEDIQTKLAAMDKHILTIYKADQQGKQMEHLRMFQSLRHCQR